MSPDFVRQTLQNEIADRLADAFFDHFRRRPGDAEHRSWQNSLRAMKDVVEYADLLDHGVILEYQLPFSSRRIDCMLLGRRSDERASGVVVELKQWESCEPSPLDHEVVTWLAGTKRDVLHPSIQSHDYRRFLQENLVVFHEEDPVLLDSCAYLHNYALTAHDPLTDPKFTTAVTLSPVFGKSDVDQLRDFLEERIRLGGGAQILDRVERSRSRASPKLMEHVSAVIQNEPRYVLLDEQKVAFDRVMHLARSAMNRIDGATVLIRGGPGTGKSVIAINLMASLMARGISAHYATGSRAFTETLRKIIGKRGSELFTYFNSYGEQEDGLDVLICDEAHRIRRTSASRWTKRSQRSERLQIDELLDAAAVSVFLIDDQQGVRPDEIGSTSLIKDCSKARGRRVFEHELDIQFRCAGSDAFIEWVENTLGARRTGSVIWNLDEEFDFRIVDSVFELEDLIRSRANAGYTSRMTAGFCWKWSAALEPNGTLRPDVKIGDFERPWNARPDARGLSKGIPRASLWAYDPRGIDQIGCVYTAQGFEFDYVGVIFGKDFRYEFSENGWVADKRESRDPVVTRSKDRFLNLVRNTYRVLLTRGMRGCYVCFLDEDTERFARSRLEGLQRTDTPPRIGAEIEESVASLVRLKPHEVRPFENAVPIYDLAIAAGQFTTPGLVEEATSEAVRSPEDFDWVSIPAHYRPMPGLFVARVEGESMNRRIPNGSWCLFKAAPAGSREGKVVVAGMRDAVDPETGSSFTVKIYASEKVADPDGSWSHTRITLRPDSNEPSFTAIELLPDEDTFWIVAELITVL